MLLSITQKSHTACVRDRDISIIYSFFCCCCFCAMTVLHVYREQNVFDLQGYSDEKRHCGTNHSFFLSQLSAYRWCVWNGCGTLTQTAESAKRTVVFKVKLRSQKSFITLGFFGRFHIKLCVPVM